MSLVELRPMLPDAIIDLRYARPDNITGAALYSPEFEPQLEDVAANALMTAYGLAQVTQHMLVVWDAYRPRSVQHQLRETNSDDRYVLDDSNHPKGLAIDLTLADSDGQLLDMGTDYDDFTEKAHAKTRSISDLQNFNRQLLATIMRQSGFEQWPYEWWHFDYQTKQQVA